MNGLIFNFYQANIFLQHGAIVESCGTEGHKTYIKFKTDEKFYDLLDRWNNHTLN